MAEDKKFRFVLRFRGGLLPMVEFEPFDSGFNSGASAPQSGKPPKFFTDVKDVPIPTRLKTIATQKKKERSALIIKASPLGTGGLAQPEAAEKLG